jgi:hypothetical protein
MAAAANQLGAAGWNYGDADGIYDLFTSSSWYGTNSGWNYVAANAYVVWQTHKQGPAPNNLYTNFNVHNSVGLACDGAKSNDWAAAGATYQNYGSLLNDLASTPYPRYVNISLRPSISEGGHDVTLVGGDYYNANGSPRGETVIHDNEGDLTNPAGDDDAYTNQGSPTWTSYNDEWECYHASTLGVFTIPLNNDDRSNYLASYYPNYTVSGTFLEEWMIRKEGYSYSDPSWLSGQSVRVFESTAFGAPPDVYLFIDYAKPMETDPLILARDYLGTPGELVEITWADARDYACYHFHFNNPSFFYDVAFPDSHYQDLQGEVIDWHFTDIPEPAALALLAAGMLVGWRPKRR